MCVVVCSVASRLPAAKMCVGLCVCGIADRAWQGTRNVGVNNNGVKRATQGDVTGSLVAVNLLGPRSTAQRPLTQFWSSHFTCIAPRVEPGAGDRLVACRHCPCSICAVLLMMPAVCTD